MKSSSRFIPIFLAIAACTAPAALADEQSSQVNATLGALFGGSGITFTKNGKQLIDPEQWSTKTQDDKTILVEQSDRGSARVAKSSIVVSKDEGGTKSVVQITGENSGGYSYAKVATVSAGAIGAISSCTRTNEKKIACVTVTRDLCRTLRSLAPGENLDKLKERLTACIKVSDLFTRAFVRHSDALLESEKENLDHIVKASQLGEDTFDFGVSPRQGGLMSDRRILADHPLTTIHGLFDVPMTTHWQAVQLCEKAYPGDMSAPRAGGTGTGRPKGPNDH